MVVYRKLLNVGAWRRRFGFQFFVDSGSALIDDRQATGFAAQQAVVENQVDEEVLLVEGEALLARFEEDAFAEFEQEMLEELADERRRKREQIYVNTNNRNS